MRSFFQDFKSNDDANPPPASPVVVNSFETTHLAHGTQTIAEQYYADGYIIHDFGFPEDLLDACAHLTRSLLGKYLRVQDLWRRNDLVKALACHAPVLELLSTLYGKRAFPFQTLNFPVGTQQGTHSDTYFFNSYPERFMCGVWVALEDVTLENGPLHYFRGSHKLPIVSKADIALTGARNITEYFSKVSQGFEKKLGLIKRGQAIIWSANLLHGGDPILDPSLTRLSQVNHYYFDNCLYYSPVNSTPEIGKIDLRAPYDFGEQRFVTPELNGTAVTPSLKARLAGRYYNYTKYVHKTPV